MSKIKVSEMFYSIQGEGRYMGVPSIFLRTYGCNFQCAGFGMPKGEKSTEADKVAEHAKEYSVYKELPLVSTGCDSYASWHPAFKHLSNMYDTFDLAQSIVDLLPNKTWGDVHLVITGGEPLLGWQRSYPELLNHPLLHNLKELTFETNGTQKLTKDFKEFLREWTNANPNVDIDQLQRTRNDLTFSVSPKLSCSGHTTEEAIHPEIVTEYQNFGFTYLKFVVATEEDAEEAIEMSYRYRNELFTGPIYLMPVGGIESVYSLNNKRVAELALKHGLRYSDRLQVPLFKNAWGT